VAASRIAWSQNHSSSSSVSLSPSCCPSTHATSPSVSQPSAWPGLRTLGFLHSNPSRLMASRSASRLACLARASAVAASTRASHSCRSSPWPMMCRHSSAGSVRRRRSSAERDRSSSNVLASTRTSLGRRGRSATARRSRKSECAAGHCSSAQPCRRSVLEGRARARRARASYRTRAAPHARAQARGPMCCATSRQTSGAPSAAGPAAAGRASGLAAFAAAAVRPAPDILSCEARSQGAMGHAPARRCHSASVSCHARLGMALYASPLCRPSVACSEAGAPRGGASAPPSWPTAS